jgi:hypothetical protein
VHLLAELGVTRVTDGEVEHSVGPHPQAAPVVHRAGRRQTAADHRAFHAHPVGVAQPDDLLFIVGDGGKRVDKSVGREIVGDGQPQQPALAQRQDLQLGERFGQ